MLLLARLALFIPALVSVAAKQAVHSHNDYEQSQPFYNAINLGVSSVEADVFLRDGKLLVAHTILGLDSSKTLDSLYVQPILKALKDGSLPKPFQLLIDFKDDGAQTLPVVVKALEPLRSGGYLTTYTSGTLTKRDVTVVGTGNTPLDGIKALTTRDIFFDAPAITVGDSNDWNVNLSPLASADFQDAIDWSFWNVLFGLYDDQRAKLAELIQKAHQKGLTTRFWNTPSIWKEEVWKDLLNAGTDWLNADDLAAASDFVKANGNRS